MKTSNILNFSASILTISLLASCGGGGGGAPARTSALSTKPKTVNVANINTLAEAGDKTIVDGKTRYTADLSSITNKSESGTYRQPYTYADVTPDFGREGGWPIGANVGVHSATTIGYQDRVTTVVVGRTENGFTLVGHLDQDSGANTFSRDPFFISSGIKPNQVPQAGRRVYTGQAFVAIADAEATGDSSYKTARGVSLTGNGNAKLTADFDRNEASIYFGQFDFERVESIEGTNMEKQVNKSTVSQNVNQTYDLGTISGNKINGTQTWEIPSLINPGASTSQKVQSSGGIYGQNGNEASVGFRGYSSSSVKNPDGTATGKASSIIGAFGGKQ